MSEPVFEKKVLHAGRKFVQFCDGTKVKFHYVTKRCDTDLTIDDSRKLGVKFHYVTKRCDTDLTIDDSRKLGKGEPLELVLGKKFKLEVWEAMVQKMAVGEVAQFTVDKNLVAQYPFVSKTLRDVHRKHDERTHTCAMSLHAEGLGYEDLNELLKSPCNLVFILELLEVKRPDEYNKECWQMSEDERIKLVPTLKEKGNADFKNKLYKEASEQYAQAIGILEQLMLKEKPHDVEWNELNEQKLPLLLNYAQCKLFEGDYYAVIEHCSTVLKTDPDNVKALFRRAKAHVGAWNPGLAKGDFNRVLELDPTLSSAVKKELARLDELIKAENEKNKEKLRNMFV